jgi:RNA-directed DNA polymerase
MNKGHQPGRSGQRPAESVEQRGLAEGNAQRPPTAGTQRPGKVSRGLLGVREAARRDRKLQFTALLHHIDRPLLQESFEALKRNAAPGVDGMTWAAYQEGSDERLQDLHHRIHTGKYRALPSKRARIPKADGSERLLGIAALEDKIVQQAVVRVLNPIYEEDFLGFSYGFRPGRDPHRALDALWVGLTERPIHWVLDMDIQSYFDHIEHDWLLRFLQHRIADKRLMRLIRKWLRAGVVDEGQWLSQEQGSPQGAVVSPLLANVYLHYVFDLWSERHRRTRAQGAMIMVRYGDDIVVGFQHREEAEAFLHDVRTRFGDFGLRLHPEKTRLIEFGRFAAARRKAAGKGKPETFDFLGFTHICSQTRKGRFTIRRRTIVKRRCAKLRAIKQELRCRMHASVPETGQWLRSVLQGYYHYFAVPYNLDSLLQLRFEVGRAWLRLLRRRSQKARRRLTREKFMRIQDPWLPKPRVYHPWPNVRFRRHHPRQEPYAVAPHVRICTGGAS